MDDRQILDAWGAGRRHPAARPLLMLAAAYPQMARDELAELPVGSANLLLLRDRQATFGATVSGEGSCPACGERLEVTVELTELVGAISPAEVAARGETRLGGVTVRFRLPSAVDLEAVAGCTDADKACVMLLRRCVLEARRGEEPVAAEELPAEVVEALDAELGRRDPLADLRLALGCPSCARRFELTLDPASLYWAELAEHAERLLFDVHRLASAYGWTEREILGLDPHRRAAYLELAG